jgi:hypothetical protein
MTRINLVLLWLLLLLFKPAILDGKHSSASNHGDGDCYLPILLREESSTNTNYRKLEESLMVYFNPKRGHFYFDQNDISFIFYEVVIEIKDDNQVISYSLLCDTISSSILFEALHGEIEITFKSTCGRNFKGRFYVST